MRIRGIPRPSVKRVQWVCVLGVARLDLDVSDDAMIDLDDLTEVSDVIGPWYMKGGAVSYGVRAGGHFAVTALQVPTPTVKAAWDSSRGAINPRILKQHT